MEVSNSNDSKAGAAPEYKHTAGESFRPGPGQYKRS